MAVEATNLYEPASTLSIGLEPWRFLPSNETTGLPSAPRGKILIVDSSAASRLSLRRMLGESDHELSEASTTSEAIGGMSLHRADLVLIGLAAPELGGIEFCKILKKAAATQFLPVFVTAGSDDLENEVLAMEAGADEFLVPPLRPKALLARVQASLRRKAVIDTLDSSETALISIAQSVEERDPDLGQHCQRLALMSAATGLALGLPASDILALQRGGYLHDVGKVGVPDHILFKPGPLSPAEWEIMKTHAERGEHICSRTRSLAPVLPIIRHHHEKWDGTGYPDGLKGEQIPLLARVLQVADIYDALTTARPYKRALSPEEALAVLKIEVARGWRDPNVVEMFSDILPMFRTPTPPDFSRLSLHALASSVTRFRKDPSQSKARSSDGHNSGGLKLANGL